MNRAIIVGVVALSALTAAEAGVRADLSGDAVIDFATTMDLPLMNVGNAGNAGEWAGESYDGYGADRICGAVDRAYRMGKFAVTAGQYVEFLNAVAADDPYGLYVTSMWSNSHTGCRIQRGGAAGSYTYSVAADDEDRAVNYVSWADAARFANWLTNGMPTGAQDLTTTEDGSYFLNGATTNVELQAVTRQPDALYVVPTEDEWYKAAFHANDGVTGNYFDYPTASDALPSNDLIDPDPGNNATFHDGGYTIAAPYWRTEAGEHENSASPYGTFDMGGNVWEWNETIEQGPYRGLRGGSFRNDEMRLRAAYRTHHNPASEYDNFGFRIAEIPEPATLGLLALGGVAILKRRRKQ